MSGWLVVGVGLYDDFAISLEGDFRRLQFWFAVLPRPVLWPLLIAMISKVVAQVDGPSQPDGDPAEPIPLPSVDNVMSGVSGTTVQAGHIGSVTFAVPPPPPAVPYQSPPPPKPYVDRGAPLALIERSVHAPRAGRPPVIVLHGMPGVGKSGLLSQGAAMVREHFSDGVLHADFGPLGHRGEVAVSEVAAGWLRAFGVPDLWIPADLRERVDLFRSMTAGRRVLVVFDNVSDDAQVTALLPSSAECLVLAASHRDLEGLVVDGAVPVRLRELKPEDAVRLLAEMCWDGRVTANDAQSRELARLCGHLPLALRVAGARLARRPGLTVARLVGELGDATRALDELSTADGARGVSAVFDVVYRNLPERTAGLYRCVGLLVGPHFGVEVMAALSDIPVASAELALDELCRTSLVVERLDGRFEPHRLVRLHAMRMSVRADAEDVRTAALRRALDWWLVGAVSADVALTGPTRLRTTAPATIIGTDPPSIPRPAALNWFDNEHENIVGLMHAAADRGWHDEVCQLFEALYAYFDNRRPLAEWVEAGGLAVESAPECTRPAAEPRARCLLAKAFQEREEYREAHDQLTLARSLAERLDDDERMLASTFDFSGNVHLRQREYDVALGYFHRALAINERLGDDRGIAMQSMLVGRALGKLERVDDAIAALRRARATAESISDEPLVCRIMLSVAVVYLDAKLDGAAGDALDETLHLTRHLDLTAIEAEALERKATLARRRGDDATEAECWRLAEAAYAKMGSPHAAQIHAQRVKER